MYGKTKMEKGKKFVIEVKDNLNGENTYLGTVVISDGKIIKEDYSRISASVCMNVEDGRPRLHSFKPGLTGLVTEIQNL